MARIAHVELEGGPGLLCQCASDLAIHAGDACIVESDGVLDYGRIAKLEEKAGEPAEGRHAKVLRQATLQDQAKDGENVLRNKMALETCAAKAQKCGLDLRLVRVRYSFDRAVLTVECTAEDTVDARDMVKELAGELRTRVDWRQIGVRDQAAIIGGIGPCGRCLCCCSWLRDFSSVNVKMAKVQKLSLNPASISGNCGRLKCCLRYEYEQYRDLARQLPPIGADVECPGGRGCVVGTDVLRQRAKVRLEDQRLADYELSEIRSVMFRRRNDRRPPDEDSGDERSESGPAGQA